VLLDYDLNQLKEFLISKKIETIDFAVFKAIASLLKEKGLLNHDDVTEDFGNPVTQLMPSWQWVQLTEMAQ
jgi:hypothetical protein